MRSNARKISILFLCTGNSCRSQMAEGWARHLWGDRMIAYSAGTKATRIDPLAVRVMREAGVDISAHRSKNTSDVNDVEIEYVVTVCDNARETCPVFPARVRLLHKSFDDPPELARHAANAEESLNHYRRVRDEIRKFVESLPDLLAVDITGRG
ncbi:arsenate reductase ArsC [bacterium]|nr:arsenate reductase ArsC [candidate division CSSED10-310 bacterium]